MEAVRKHEFYECCLVELRALKSLAERYARAAREKAESTDYPRRSELTVIAETLERVPAEPARTFREAIQSAHFFLGTLFGLYPLGRPDRDFIAYYEHDLAEGRITREEAQELIDNYCLAVSTRVFSRAACGFIVGGQDAAGNLVENELTYMFLTALDHIRMPDPNGALAVNSRTSADILRYAAKILSRGVTHPAFYNDEAIIRSLERYGCRHEDAVNYVHTTCAEISIVGRSRAHTTLCVVVLPRLLTRAVREAAENASFETLVYAFVRLIEETLRTDLMRYFQRLVEAGRNGNEPMRVCALVEECPARGKSVYEGGERYTFLQPILVGFATAVDSLCAIRQLVYDEKAPTLEAFLSIVDRNFEGEESLRQRLIRRLPHYGNNDAAADSMAARLAGAIEEIFRSRRLPAADVMTPGTFSYIMHATRGMHDGATFDGRLAHTSYSDGCSPVQGRDTHGPTAMVLSLTGWDQSLFLAGMVLNVKFTPTHLSADGGALFIAMLLAFIERGGLEMQVNAVRRKTLEDAQTHPDAHGDLIVRIGGYSDYFTRLSPVLQDEIIARTEY